MYNLCKNLAKNLLYAYLGCHGLTDISLSTEIWIPMYSLACVYGFLLPYRVLVGCSYILSCVHFATDVGLSWRILGIYCGCLSWLIYFRKRKWSPTILLGYMSIIHTPLHFSRHLSYENLIYVAGAGCFLTLCKPYQRYVSRILYHDQIIHESFVTRSLLSIINGHILTHWLLTFTYLHPNHVNYYLCYCING